MTTLECKYSENHHTEKLLKLGKNSAKYLELEATEGRLERSNLIGSDLTLYKEWQLSVDLKLRRNQNWNGGSGHWQDGWANLFALQA